MSQITEHLHEHYGELSQVLEAEVFRRGLHQATLEEVYACFQTYFQPIYRKLKLTNPRTDEKIDEILLRILKSAHGPAQAQNLLAGLQRLSGEERFLCILNGEQLSSAVQGLLKKPSPSSGAPFQRLSSTELSKHQTLLPDPNGTQKHQPVQNFRAPVTQSVAVPGGVLVGQSVPGFMHPTAMSAQPNALQTSLQQQQYQMYPQPQPPMAKAEFQPSAATVHTFSAQSGGAAAYNSSLQGNSNPFSSAPPTAPPLQHHQHYVPQFQQLQSSSATQMSPTPKSNGGSPPNQRSAPNISPAHHLHHFHHAHSQKPTTSPGPKVPVLAPISIDPTDDEIHPAKTSAADVSAFLGEIGLSHMGSAVENLTMDELKQMDQKVFNSVFHSSSAPDRTYLWQNLHGGEPEAPSPEQQLKLFALSNDIRTNITTQTQGHEPHQEFVDPKGCHVTLWLTGVKSFDLVAVCEAVSHFGNVVDYGYYLDDTQRKTKRGSQASDWAYFKLSQWSPTLQELKSIPLTGGAHSPKLTVAAVEMYRIGSRSSVPPVPPQNAWEEYQTAQQAKDDKKVRAVKPKRSAPSNNSEGGEQQEQEARGPRKKFSVPCRFFSRGGCARGEDCLYLHN